MSMSQLWIAFGAILALAIVLFGIGPLWLMARRRPRGAPPPASFAVTIEEGAAGAIRYREGAHEHRFDWEPAAEPPSVGFVHVPTYEQWADAVPWAPHRREEILERVATELRLQKCPRCRWDIEESSIHLFER